MFMSAALGVAWIWRFKRADVSWLHLLAAGPMIYFRPSSYVEPRHATVPKVCFGLALILFVVVWTTGWIHNNL
jgi:hypothetical protein